MDTATAPVLTPGPRFPAMANGQTGHDRGSSRLQDQPVHVAGGFFSDALRPTPAPRSAVPTSQQLQQQHQPQNSPWYPPPEQAATVHSSPTRFPPPPSPSTNASYQQNPAPVQTVYQPVKVAQPSPPQNAHSQPVTPNRSYQGHFAPQPQPYNTYNQTRNGGSNQPISSAYHNEYNQPVSSFQSQSPAPPVYKQPQPPLNPSFQPQQSPTRQQSPQSSPYNLPKQSPPVPNNSFHPQQSPTRQVSSNFSPQTNSYQSPTRQISTQPALYNLPQQSNRGRPFHPQQSPTGQVSPPVYSPPQQTTTSNNSFIQQSPTRQVNIPYNPPQQNRITYLPQQSPTRQISPPVYSPPQQTNSNNSFIQQSPTRQVNSQPIPYNPAPLQQNRTYQQSPTRQVSPPAYNQPQQTNPISVLHTPQSPTRQVTFNYTPPTSSPSHQIPLQSRPQVADQAYSPQRQPSLSPSRSQPHLVSYQQAQHPPRYQPPPTPPPLPPTPVKYYPQRPPQRPPPPLNQVQQLPLKVFNTPPASPGSSEWTSAKPPPGPSASRPSTPTLGRTTLRLGSPPPTSPNHNRSRADVNYGPPTYVSSQPPQQQHTIYLQSVLRKDNNSGKPPPYPEEKRRSVTFSNPLATSSDHSQPQPVGWAKVRYHLQQQQQHYPRRMEPTPQAAPPGGPPPPRPPPNLTQGPHGPPGPQGPPLMRPVNSQPPLPQQQFPYPGQQHINMQGPYKPPMQNAPRPDLTARPEMMRPPQGYPPPQMRMAGPNPNMQMNAPRPMPPQFRGGPPPGEGQPPRMFDGVFRDPRMAPPLRGPPPPMQPGMQGDGSVLMRKPNGERRNPDDDDDVVTVNRPLMRQGPGPVMDPRQVAGPRVPPPMRNGNEPPNAMLDMRQAKPVIPGGPPNLPNQIVALSNQQRPPGMRPPPSSASSFDEDVQNDRKQPETSPHPQGVQHRMPLLQGAPDPRSRVPQHFEDGSNGRTRHADDGREFPQNANNGFAMRISGSDGRRDDQRKISEKERPHSPPDADSDVVIKRSARKSPVREDQEKPGSAVHKSERPPIRSEEEARESRRTSSDKTFERAPRKISPIKEYMERPPSASGRRTSIVNNGLGTKLFERSSSFKYKYTDGDHDSGVDESTQGKETTPNGHVPGPTVPAKLPTRPRGRPRDPSAPPPGSASSNLKSPLKSPRSASQSAPRTPDGTQKKLPMNKIQVGAAPSPNLKTVRSKIGSLQNASYKPGGGKVKIENRKLEWKAAPKIEALNDAYVPKGGDKKIEQKKLVWTAKSKIGSLDNTSYKPGGGDKKIESQKLDFKDKAKSRIGSKDNMSHRPGGGSVKIEDQKLEFKAESKIGSMDNVKYRPGGGDKKIFDDKEYLRQMSASSSQHGDAWSQRSSRAPSEGRASGAHSPMPRSPSTARSEQSEG